jgi:ankyrin repeat protein
MVASAHGNVREMRRLFEKKLASPHDITDGNKTPLSLSIESGNAHAVELLLDQGADFNNPFGTRQTSYLAWALKHRHIDIARLLVDRKASFHHLNTYGWSPLFYLWSCTERQPSSSDFLTMLASDSDFKWLHTGLVDIEGWGLIHRAAIFGAPEEVQLLITMKADPFQTIGELGWTVLHNVVYHGVYDVFLVLLPYYKAKGFDLPDVAGWSLLHIAAAEGHEEIILHLLQLGANTKARTHHGPIDVPDCDDEGSWTPAEIAFLHGERKGRLFKQLLEAYLDEKEESLVWYDTAEVIDV